ncbi:MAG: DUF948 domain-containing protein [Bifidobacterium sp.]|uniref:DUF948 domain-containing protein n=1 Tax=Bifidobacterium mellis TaxID=1293823 RepID=A0A0F4KUV3_9BIFI|nr:DUF948 domain-containing protein [Bifidobacterium mellis]KJY50190.1 Uncharacterized protein JF70_08750 [Bifidobacterium mellis]MCT6900524.1 DUF948 domain-containing protein [Bifidobacterium sp.]
MDVGQIAGLIAAIAFAILAGFLIYPLIRLGKLFDQLAQTIKQAGDHVVPTLDESTSTVTQLNQTLTDVNRISAAASTTAGNLGALTDLYGSMLGKPVIKAAAFLYALRKTISSFLSGGRDSAESKPSTAKKANDGQGNEGSTR